MSDKKFDIAKITKGMLKPNKPYSLSVRVSHKQMCALEEQENYSQFIREAIDEKLEREG